MAQAAEARGQKGRYAVTLSRSIYEPFTTFSDRRDLREIAFRAFINRGENGGATDNREVVAKTLSLRAEKARLLGYDSYAALKLDDTMAKTAVGRVRPARSGLGQGARKGGERPGGNAAPRRRGRAQSTDRRLGLALLPGEAAGREIRLRRGRAEALSAARARSSPPVSTWRRGCSASASRSAGRCRLASGRARLRGAQCRRHASRHVPRRLFRTRLEAVGRLDERAAIRPIGSARARSRSSTTS